MPLSPLFLSFSVSPCIFLQAVKSEIQILELGSRRVGVSQLSVKSAAIIWAFYFILFSCLFFE